MWVRCYGILKWNEDKTLPLFFSGRVSHQDDAFVIDPVTNFPREQALLSYLDEVKGKKSTALAIGFSFNSIAEINSTRGRTYSDHLVENIATDLMEKLSDKMSFYRLEGMRCAAILGCRLYREPGRAGGTDPCHCGQLVPSHGDLPAAYLLLCGDGVPAVST